MKTSHRVDHRAYYRAMHGEGGNRSANKPGCGTAGLSPLSLAKRINPAHSVDEAKANHYAAEGDALLNCRRFTYWPRQTSYWPGVVLGVLSLCFLHFACGAVAEIWRVVR